ncbi:hypothetical protein Back11_26030 [Paenibacillus baekrokdamisoli]|uniref:Uncharacterized protein n=1 Tax=Paenibacillus baekrokdamisoli TaxID=1712516 RepID=A0A3G9JBK8_9BACL|nr:hypothetical protein [Paenibacillus baekrokdamisoli]MBB3070253.1 hypothetical protein [Paenibacillus baekrokdamisoli]BBH21258.1 hypothetical protein Back11_26030 [Paenibacillus baekrokdamisoli]
MERRPDYSPHDDTETRPGYHQDSHAYNEEMSAELAAPSSIQRINHSDRPLEEEAVRKTRSAGHATGWAALVIALLSWFVWPVLLGATAAVVGFLAYRQGARGLGIWSITLGLIALATYLVLIPIYYAIT